MTDKEHLRDKLHTTNRRMTRQRQLVLETLEHSHDHLDVESLYQRIKTSDPNISLATVYRTLAVLKEMGLVEKGCISPTRTCFSAAIAPSVANKSSFSSGQDADDRNARDLEHTFR